MSYTNIDDVIIRIQSISNYCKQSNSRLGYFAALYLRMTIAVKEAIQNGVFEDGKRMEQLDICFAERYTTAWECYIKKQPCTQSWQYAFDNMSDQRPIVLQCLLLGINTHINLDLAIAAATIAPGNSIYLLEKDFNRINQIIGSLVNDVQECLAHVWIPLRLLIPIANGKQIAILNFSIDKARVAAWSNAVLLATMTPAQQATQINIIDNVVKTIATNIANPGTLMKFLVKKIRASEYDNPAQTISLIESMNVKS